MDNDINSNDNTPITEKSIARVINIALAKMNRSYNLKESEWTILWSELDEKKKKTMLLQFKNSDEEGLLVTWVNDSNWTLLTSHYIYGKRHGKSIKAQIRKILDYDFDHVKGNKGEIRIFTVKLKWVKKEFLYETNGSGFMLWFGLDVLHTHWIRNAIKK